MDDINNRIEELTLALVEKESAAVRNLSLAAICRVHYKSWKFDLGPLLSVQRKNLYIHISKILAEAGLRYSSDSIRKTMKRLDEERA